MIHAINHFKLSGMTSCEPLLDLAELPKSTVIADGYSYSCGISLSLEMSVTLIAPQI